MGECAGAGNYNDSDYGSPACSNRESPPRRRVSTRPVERPVVDKPAPNHFYNLTVELVTTSGENLSFNLQAIASWSLENIQKQAEQQARAHCRTNAKEMSSFEIVELVLV